MPRPRCSGWTPGKEQRRATSSACAVMSPTRATARTCLRRVPWSYRESSSACGESRRPWRSLYRRVRPVVMGFRQLDARNTRRGKRVSNGSLSMLVRSLSTAVIAVRQGSTPGARTHHAPEAPLHDPNFARLVGPSLRPTSGRKRVTSRRRRRPVRRRHGSDHVAMRQTAGRRLAAWRGRRVGQEIRQHEITSRLRLHRRG